MLKNAVLSVAVVLALASAASAYTVTYTMSVDTSASPMTWDVYATVSPDTNGLANFIVSVVATGDLQLLSSQNLTSNPPFSQIRSDGTLSAQESFEISAGQQLIYQGTNNPAKDVLVTQGLGVGAPLLIAGGTFSGTNGTLTVTHEDGIVSILKKVGGGAWMGPGNLSSADMPTPTLANGGVVNVNVPEPATLSVLALAGLSMMIRRRRA